ncbi:MAG: hypothetical protein AAFY73_05805 [Pseudomonadota bacterium]
MRRFIMLSTAAATAAIGCVMVLVATQPVYADERDCKTPRFDTRVSNFMSKGGVGSVGFAFSKRPLKVQVVSSGACYKLQKSFRRKRVYFFFNHLTTSDERYATFLATQIVKKYKNLRFADERVTGIRKGAWFRRIDGGAEDLAQIGSMLAFDSVSPERFGELHRANPFDEVPLIDSFRGRFWHGTPMEADVGSLDRLSYWSSQIADDPSTKVENYLLRFEALASDEKPEQNGRGIPFNTRFHSDMEYMHVKVHSPADGGIQLNFRLE